MGQKKLTPNGSANRMSPRDIPTGEYYAMIIARLEREKGVLEKEVKRLRREVGILTKRNRKTGGEGGKEKIKEEAIDGERKKEEYTGSEAASILETRLRPEAKEFRPPVVPPPPPPPPPPSPTPSIRENVAGSSEDTNATVTRNKAKTGPHLCKRVTFDFVPTRRSSRLRAREGTILQTGNSVAGRLE